MLSNKKRAQARQRKAQLVLHGITMRAVAANLGIRAETVGQVVGGYRTSRRIKAEVARMLNRRVEDLWPEGNNRAA